MIGRIFAFLIFMEKIRHFTKKSRKWQNFSPNPKKEKYDQSVLKTSDYCLTFKKKIKHFHSNFTEFYYF